MNEEDNKLSGMHQGAATQIFRNAVNLRVSMTEAEIKLWEYLKGRPMGFKFRRQHPISKYILDFYCHKLMLSIEVDGGYHFSKEQKIKDEDRTNYLKSIGIVEVRFTNEQVLNNYPSVIDSINGLLQPKIMPRP